MPSLKKSSRVLNALRSSRFERKYASAAQAFPYAELHKMWHFVKYYIYICVYPNFYLNLRRVYTVAPHLLLYSDLDSRSALRWVWWCSAPPVMAESGTSSWWSLPWCWAPHRSSAKAPTSLRLDPNSHYSTKATGEPERRASLPVSASCITIITIIVISSNGPGPNGIKVFISALLDAEWSPVRFE